MIAESQLVKHLAPPDVKLSLNHALLVAHFAASLVGLSAILRLYLGLLFLPSHHCLVSAQDPTENDILSRDGFECIPLAFEDVDVERIRTRAGQAARLLITTSEASHEPGRLTVSVPRCSKCDNRWKPPRTRHCSICRKCRVGFDHHCPVSRRDRQVSRRWC